MLSRILRQKLTPVARHLPSLLKTKIKEQLPADFGRDGYFHVMSPFRTFAEHEEAPRVTLILPSVHKDHLTGGPATLVNYMLEIKQRFPNVQLRLLPVMVPFTGGQKDLPSKLSEFEILRGETTPAGHSILGDAAHKANAIPIRRNEVFIASMWPTFFVAEALREQQLAAFETAQPVQYIIQDYEPLALFPWSDFYLLARHTYDSETPTIALVATDALSKYVKQEKHKFLAHYSFDPNANATPVDPEDFLDKEDTILVYARPDTPRNCFNIIFETLLKVTADHPQIAERFRFVSVGENHPSYKLNNGAKLESLGFMPPKVYKQEILKAAIGMFFVVSPHTGYVALELARGGALSISNSFETKDVSLLHPNVRVPEDMTVPGVADTLVEAVREYWRNPNGGHDTARATHKNQNNNQVNFPFLEEMFQKHHSKEFVEGHKS